MSRFTCHSFVCVHHPSCRDNLPAGYCLLYCPFGAWLCAINSINQSIYCPFYSKSSSCCVFARSLLADGFQLTICLCCLLADGFQLARSSCLFSDGFQSRNLGICMRGRESPKFNYIRFWWNLDHICRFPRETQWKYSRISRWSRKGVKGGRQPHFKFRRKKDGLAVTR